MPLIVGILSDEMAYPAAERYLQTKLYSELRPRFRVELKRAGLRLKQAGVRMVFGIGIRHGSFESLKMQEKQLEREPF